MINYIFSLMTLSRYLSGYEGGGSKREWSAPYPPPVSFCVSYNVWFCLFTFHVFLTYRCSCGTMKTEFYVQQEFFSILRGYPIQVNHS